MRVPTFVLLCCVVALAGCGRDRAPAAMAATPGEASSGAIADFGEERVWQGVLPCSDCEGIDTRLVLQQQGNSRRYRLEETYLGAASPNHFERKGQWIQAQEPTTGAPAVLFVLDPERAPRRFRLEPDGGLELLTAGADAQPVPEYRLQRL
jgi:copper homeostasis protein (lipoprotein)